MSVIQPNNIYEPILYLEEGNSCIYNISRGEDSSDNGNSTSALVAGGFEKNTLFLKKKIFFLNLHFSQQHNTYLLIVQNYQASYNITKNMRH